MKRASTSTMYSIYMYVYSGGSMLPLVQLGIFLCFTFIIINYITIHQNKGKCQIVPRVKLNPNNNIDYMYNSVHYYSVGRNSRRLFYSDISA